MNKFLFVLATLLFVIATIFSPVKAQGTSEGATCSYKFDPDPTNGLLTEQKYTVKVSMKNTGNTTWAKPDYYLQAVNPQYSQTAWGISKVDLPKQSITPGQTAEFTLNITAPANIGTFDFNWQMFNGDNGFGSTCQPAFTVSSSTAEGTPGYGSLEGCKSDCGLCSTKTTCGFKTYDGCVDDKDQADTSSNFCKNGATKFTCKASFNNNCTSNELEYDCNNASSCSTPKLNLIYNSLCVGDNKDKLELLANWSDIDAQSYQVTLYSGGAIKQECLSTNQFRFTNQPAGQYQIGVAAYSRANCQGNILASDKTADIPSACSIAVDTTNNFTLQSIVMNDTNQTKLDLSGNSLTSIHLEASENNQQVINFQSHFTKGGDQRRYLYPVRFIYTGSQPTGFVNVSPLNGEVDLQDKDSINFIWTSAKNAVKYKLLATNGNSQPADNNCTEAAFKNFAICRETATTSLNISKDKFQNTAYKWHIIAYDAAGKIINTTYGNLITITGASSTPPQKFTTSDQFRDYVLDSYGFTPAAQKYVKENIKFTVDKFTEPCEDKKYLINGDSSTSYTTGVYDREGLKFDCAHDGPAVEIFGRHTFANNSANEFILDFIKDVVKLADDETLDLQAKAFAQGIVYNQDGSYCYRGRGCADVHNITFDDVFSVNSQKVRGDFIFEFFANFTMGQYKTGPRALPEYMWKYFEPVFTGNLKVKPYYEGGNP